MSLCLIIKVYIVMFIFIKVEVKCKFFKEDIYKEEIVIRYV